MVVSMETRKIPEKLRQEVVTINCEFSLFGLMSQSYYLVAIF